MCNGHCLLPCLAVVQKFCNAEIQQFGYAGRRHQNIRGLQVPMHDEVLVGVMDGGAHGLKQPEPGGNIQAVGVAEGVDGDAIDVFHDDVHGAVRQSAAVQEMRDVRMIELSEDLALDPEPRLDSSRQRPAVNDFDGYLLLELRVRPLGKENLPHAAHAQGAQHPIRSDASSGHFQEHAPGPG